MQNLKDLDINNKTILLRCDYNVPMKDNKIEDDTKIKKSIPTIHYLLEKNCKIIILSHFGRVKTIEDKLTNSLEPVANHLSNLLKKEIVFLEDCMNPNIKKIINELPSQSIILLENTRFSDVPIKQESICDEKLAKFWASLADIFVLDAFGSCHRKHSSTYGIANYLPSCIGFLVEQEISMLDNIIHVKKHPFTILMGGAKVDDKLSLLKKLIAKCDYIIISGGMANSFLKAKNINTGKSLATEEENILTDLKNIMDKYQDKIYLPIDFVVLNNNEVYQRNIDEIQDEDTILDIGQSSINKFKDIIIKSQVLFMNGTMGKYEDVRFQKGTYELLDFIAENDLDVYVGGGDTISAVKKFKFDEKIQNLSTGGGATLDYIANENLIALENIGVKKYE